MAKIKRQVIALIESLPEKSSIDDIMETLYFKKQVDEGMLELGKGKEISHEKALRRLL